jgi:phosphoglycerol geranylgeranyltransferase
MNLDWTEIDHITKIDPEKSIPQDIEPLGHTDLVIVGGSDGVTEANTLEVIHQVTESFPDLPVFQEPYKPEQVSMETISTVDYLSIPAIFNGDRTHFVGKHLSLFTEISNTTEKLLDANVPASGQLLQSKGVDVVSKAMDKIFAEGYVVQHTNSKAAQVSAATEPFSSEEVAGAALATEAFYNFPVFYVEYSGQFGGTADVKAAAKHLDETALLYGGGIDSAEKASDVLSAGADAIVVGDCFHDDTEQFFETIPSV